MEMDIGENASWRVKLCMFLIIPAMAWIELTHHLLGCSAKIKILTRPYGEDISGYEL